MDAVPPCDDWLKSQDAPELDVQLLASLYRCLSLWWCSDFGNMVKLRLEALKDILD